MCCKRNYKTGHGSVWLPAVGLLSLLITVVGITSCRKEFKYTYTVEGQVCNITGAPLNGIILQLSTSYQATTAATVQSNSNGQFYAALPLESKHRALLLLVTDPTATYRDTTLQINYAQNTHYTFSEPIVLPKRKQHDF